MVRLLKSYELNTGKIMPIGKVLPRSRKEAEQMIKENIAELYSGPRPHKMKTRDKMKTDLFKPK